MTAFKTEKLIFAPIVKSSKAIYSAIHKLSAFTLMLTLLWLTVSMPFVYEQQQAAKKALSKTGNFSQDNPNNNTTEEKSESGVAMPSEYLHSIHTHEQDYTLVITRFACHDADTYIAYHPEAITPPPDVISA